MKKIISLFVIVIFVFIGCKQSNKKEIIAPKKEKESFHSKQISVYGIDISKYQGGEVSELNKKKDSISFIICKATEGITYTDPKFSYNWSAIKEKGFIRGAYHFYRSNDEPVKQAQNFLNAIKGIEKTDIPPIIDFEIGGIVNKSKNEKQIKETQDLLKIFISQIEEELKCKPIIYTSFNVGNTYLNDPFFANYPLWIANYTTKEKPNLPSVWKENSWSIWQKSDNYVLDGITDDLDKFNGNLQGFEAFVNKSWQ